MEKIEKKNKLHRIHKKGGKIEKKKKKDGVKKVGNNPKAFTFKSAVKAQRLIRRAANLSEKKKHIPLIDRTPVEPPPLLVAIVGPSKVGKTTLLRCLIKHYVHQNISEIKGPVTIVTGKTKRVTFLEVPNDMNAMIDASKVADLILLLIDASFGFEMETFEIINTCQVHGMPKVMGILTHMDLVEKSSKLKSIKKVLKHRFWTEVYAGAKLFYLTNLLNNQYLKHEIKNLARFISVTKLRPIIWRTTHPYILCDRFEDLTDPEVIRQNPTSNRKISLYGWVRGTNFKTELPIHIPGLGDIRLQSIAIFDDPCPLPINQKKGRRSLNEKEQIVYAPFSGLGGVVYDKDAIYIDTRGSHALLEKADDNLQSALGRIKVTLDEKLKMSKMTLLSDSVPLGEFEEDEDEDEFDLLNHELENSVNEFKNEKNNCELAVEKKNDCLKTKISSAISKAHQSTWSDLKEHANSIVNKKSRINWFKIIYGDNDEKEILQSSLNDKQSDDEEELAGGLFKIAKHIDETKNKRLLKDKEDGFCYLEPCTSNFFQTSTSFDKLNWDDELFKNSICDCFVTGDWDPEDDADEFIKSQIKADKINKENLDDNVKKKNNMCKERSDEESNNEDTTNDSASDNSISDEDSDNNKSEEENKVNFNLESKKYVDGKVVKEKKKKKKDTLRERFDAEFDVTNDYYNKLKEDLDQQANLNKTVFDGMDESLRCELEGFRAGLYVRIEISDIPSEFVDNFNANFPYIIGGLLPGEQNLGYVQVRMKKHRWYDRILKSRDPLIISCGWRRFQTMMVYSVQDHNHRQRFFKYTPKDSFCYGTFWGPLIAQNTGFLGLQSLDEELKSFRIAATGIVLGMDKSFKIVKKLKLIGKPSQIFKKTAFIEGMFNNALEVERFHGAAIRTVSGIRGLLKKSLRTPEGAFRASFEDKIKLSDIVFLRSWITVFVPQFYIPVTDKLLPVFEKWVGMKTVGRLRYEKNLKIEYKPGWGYHRQLQKENDEKRLPFAQSKLVIPKKLQKKLPYNLKPKFKAQSINEIVSRKRGLNSKKNDDLVTKCTAVILEPHESRVNEFMNMLNVLKEDQELKEAELQNKKQKKRLKETAEIEARRKKKMMATKKAICRNLSKREAKRLKNALDEIGA